MPTLTPTDATPDDTTLTPVNHGPDDAPVQVDDDGRPVITVHPAAAYQPGPVTTEPTADTGALARGLGDILLRALNPFASVQQGAQAGISAIGNLAQAYPDVARAFIPFAQSPGAPETGRAALNLASGLWHDVGTPFRLMQGVQPETPGTITEWDEQRRADLEEEARSWAARQAVNRMATGTPFAATGQAGVFGGRLAATADLPAMRQAVTMEKAGATRDAIRDATGWVRDVDGQWKFEIPDVGAKATPGFGKLSDVLEHPELFRAYPHLRDVGVDFSVGRPGGFFQPATGRTPAYMQLRGSTEGTSYPLTSVALHEIQHAIQQKERFAPGSNPAYAPSFPQAEDLAQQAAESTGRTWNTLTTTEQARWIDHTQRALAHQWYLRSAGEAEARNVQTRLGLSPEDLKTTPPWTTLDRPQEQLRVEPPIARPRSMAFEPGPDAPGVGVAAENKLGFVPGLRVMATDTGPLPDKPLITQATTNANAPRQITAIDQILADHPDAASSPQAWSRMQAHAYGSADVPVPPYAFIRDINGPGAAEKLRTLTPGQIADADHGFTNARRYRQAYESGQIAPADTGKLFLWSFLSRGVSPYTQESMFLDAYDGIEPWINKAVAGQFTAADLPAYRAWTATTAPKGSGQPGAGTMHNLNAFGENFLIQMAKPAENGQPRLQYLHDMLSNPTMTGQQIRREFLKFGEGSGIDNKIVSFTLLVAGHDDVMVLDRVQTRQLWDDGRFADRNLYDGQRNAEGKIITGTPLAQLTYGARGLLQYEAIEDALAKRVKDIYTAVGRPQDASIGRYHWETWVAHSQQEASHGTLGAILDKNIAQVSAKQGEYGAYEYGARYGRSPTGERQFTYRTPSGQEYNFSVPAFRGFLEDIKNPSIGVVPRNFKVTESGNAPWFQRPEVNRERLDERARAWADVEPGRPQAYGRQQGAGHPGAGGFRAPSVQGRPTVTLHPVPDDYNPFAGMTHPAGM